jgi:DNA-binding MarR family transcriptional regulator
MMSDRLENLLGALALAVGDEMSAAAEAAAGHSGALAAGLAVLAQEPGLGIEQLREPLARTQSATVRVVDQLVAAGQAERRPGRDQRSVSVHLTDAGMAAAGQVLDARAAVLRAALGGLDAGERAALAGLLEKVLARLAAGPLPDSQVCRLCDVGACPPRRCPVELAVRPAAPGGARVPGGRPPRPVPAGFRQAAGARPGG